MNPRLLALTLVLGVSTHICSADLLRYEPFDYTAGATIQGLNNPSGSTWERAGTANPPSAILVGSGSLSMPGDLLASGNSARINGIGNGSGSFVRLGLGQTITSGTVYYSFGLRIDALTGANNVTGGFFTGLNNSTGSQSSNPSAVAAKVQSRIDPLDATKYNLGIFRNINATAAATSWSGPLTVGETLFVVCSYEIVPGLQNDIARMWINPDANTFGDTEPTATLVDNTTLSGSDISIASILLRQSPAPYVSLDELRVGTSWISVTTVPEPSAATLAVLFGLGLALFRRSPH